MDGLYGSVVIRQPPSKDPNSYLYDFDLTTHVILLSDWMHEDAAERFPGRLAVRITILINIINFVCSNLIDARQISSLIMSMFSKDNIISDMLLFNFSISRCQV